MKRGPDRIHHAIQILHHVGICEPDHPISLIFQESRATGIPRLRLRPVVCVAVNLYHEACRLTHEVREIDPQALLATEFEAVKPRTA